MKGRETGDTNIDLEAPGVGADISEERSFGRGGARSRSGTEEGG